MQHTGVGTCRHDGRVGWKLRTPRRGRRGAIQPLSGIRAHRHRLTGRFALRCMARMWPPALMRRHGAWWPARGCLSRPACRLGVAHRSRCVSGHRTPARAFARTLSSQPSTPLAHSGMGCKGPPYNGFIFETLGHEVVNGVAVNGDINAQARWVRLQGGPSGSRPTFPALGPWADRARWCAPLQSITRQAALGSAKPHR